MSAASWMATAVARAVRRACLLVVPARVRRTYRDDMAATFDAALADAAARGPLAVLRTTVREVADLAGARAANRPAPVAFGGGRTGGAGGAWLRGTAWRQAWRSLRRRPAFAAAAVVTLGAGTAAICGVGSLVDTILIRPLPYPDADRLVTVMESSPSARDRTSLVAPGRLEDWRRLTHAFAGISGSYAENVTDTSGDEPLRLEGRRVAPEFFAVYGTAPIAGRWLTDEEERANGPGAAVISEGLWQRRFNRDPLVTRRALAIGGRSYQIVGVMPATFTGAATDVWLPAEIPPSLLQVREARFLSGVGRLRAGVSVEAAAADLRTVQNSLAAEYPKTDQGWSVEIRPLKEARVGAARQGLLLVLAAVAALWAIAVANVAGLTLIEMRRRARELAVRVALGASRPAVIGTVLREGLIVAALGAAAGIGLAIWAVPALRGVLPDTPRINELTLGWRVPGFAVLNAALAACAFSLIPALTVGRAARRAGVFSRGVAAGRHGAQKTLVIGQVALSVVLVGSATVLLQSYYRLMHADTGVDPSGVVTFHVGARWDEDRTRIGQMQRALLERIEELPYVEAAGLTNFLPATGATLRYPVQIGGIAGANADGTLNVGTRMVSRGYLQAMGVGLRSGEWCPAMSADPAASSTAMVNQRLVDAYAPHQNLVGRTLRIPQFNGPPARIVGVVDDVAEDGQGMAAAPYVYTCDGGGSWPDPEYVVHTTGASSLPADLRRIIHEIDPDRAIFGYRPVQAVLEAALAQPRADAAMLGLFAAAAIALAGVGLYSLFMLLVSESAREIAVRLALGAAPGQVARLILGGALRLLAGGLALGIGLTAVVDLALRGAVFGVRPLDPMALGAAVAVLSVVAMIATAGPALAALRVAPVVALRGE